MRQTVPKPRVSIIIPARNDAQALARTLNHLAGVRDVGAAEIIVAASGDPQGTRRAVGTRARLCWPGGSTRAQLMNAGAAMARGDALLFLHADSLLPPNALSVIEAALADDRVVGGAFEHLFDEPSLSLRLISYINRVRYRLTHNYYGDQGIFVRAPVFRALRGYRDLGVLEDLDFTRRLKRRGRTVLGLAPLRTSGRRFLSRGPWRTFCFIVWLLFLYTLGFDTGHYAERWRGPADRVPGMPWPEDPTGLGLAQPRGLRDR
jgi:rSAM/selenodomain-associated transferase 2